MANNKATRNQAQAEKFLADNGYSSYFKGSKDNNELYATVKVVEDINRWNAL